jgi:predicted dehydrogenase
MSVLLYRVRQFMRNRGIMSNASLRVGIIGAGIGKSHAEGYAKQSRVTIAAIAGLDERVKTLAATYGARTYGDYSELLAQPDIDAVSVCVPNGLHAEVTIAALKAGKHVLVEKPLARNPAEGESMLAAAKAAGKTLMISFNHRQRSDVQYIKQMIDSGRLGRIYYAKSYWMRRAGIPGINSWFVNKEMAGGGPMIDLGVHMLDIAMYLMGEPTPLAVTAATYAEFGPRGQKGSAGIRQEVKGNYGVEDLATAMIRLDGGATLHLETSWATHGPNGDDFGIILYGTEGGAELKVVDYNNVKTVRIFYDEKDGTPVDLVPNIKPGGGHVDVIKNFVEAVLDGAPAIPSAEDGLRRTQVIDACYRSSAEAREIRL